MVQAMEQRGELEFGIVTNDGTEDSFTQLVELKNIFGKQLPKMPKAYICRLVFDKQHYSLICKYENVVVGGICYRPHFTQGFAEIAFCAVTASRQVKGFGTRMMNQLKEAVKADGIEYLLTYADNYAIGYFKKQGFQRQITMKRERWVGFIKDYDGATLLEQKISFHVDYTNLPQIIEEQRQAILDKLRAIAKAHITHPSLTDTRPFKVNADGEAVAVLKVVRRAEDIPGLAETGYKLEECTYTFRGESKSLEDVLLTLVELVANHDLAWPFREAVKPEEAPDYHQVIKSPIDLSLIRRKIDIGTCRVCDPLPPPCQRR